MAPVKPGQFTVTTVPAGPDAGLKPEIVGAVGVGDEADTYALRHTLPLATLEVKSDHEEPVELT